MLFGSVPTEVIELPFAVPFLTRLFIRCLLPVLLLGGCTFVSVAYNHADTAVHWIADDYFDFDADQSAQFQQGLRRVHAWHREYELPRYASLFFEAARRIEGGLKPADLEWAERMLRERYQALAQAAAPDLAEVLSTLTPDQRAAMEDNFARTNRKFRKEYLAGTPEQRERKRVKKALDRVEEWVGPLEPGQERHVRTLLEALPDTAEERYAHRLARQQAFRELLDAGLPPAKLEAGLVRWMLAWETGRSAEHQRLSAQWRRQMGEFLLELVSMLGWRQRTHLMGKLRDYARQFDRLSDQHVVRALDPGGG